MGSRGGNVSCSTAVVAVVGVSNSGKTTVAAALVGELVSRGYRVAAIKHCPHGHDSAPGNVDTDRLFDSGADLSVAVSPGRMTFVERCGDDPPLQQIVERARGGFDVIIAEGYKSSDFPKILVDADRQLPVAPSNLIATVGERVNGYSVPHFSRGDVEGLASMVEEYLFARESASDGVSLVVDGVAIPLNRFPAEALSGTILGFLKTLDGVSNEPRSVEISISKRRPGSHESSFSTIDGDVSLRAAADPAADREPANLIPG